MNRNILKAKIKNELILEIAEVIDSLYTFEVNEFLEEAACNFIISDLKEAENIIDAFFEEALRVGEENPNKFENFVPNRNNEKEFIRWANLVKKSLLSEAYNSMINYCEWITEANLRGRVLNRKEDGEELDKIVNLIATCLFVEYF